MATTASAGATSARGARVLLALLCLGLAVGGLLYRGHSVESMDVRTYAQMIRGVADHGLPYWENGPVDEFPALVVQWGIPAHGHIWGIYGALYPYLVAPIFRFGGLESVSGFTFAFLAPLALATFLLARRIVRSEWTATIAAFLAVFSTPAAGKSLEITPFGLITVFATFGLWLTVRLVETRSSWSLEVAGSSLAAGLTWAAASAGHALCFPMALASFAVLAAAPEPGEALALPQSREAIRGALRSAGPRLVPALLGFVVGISPVALLNRVRFGSYNPISYGPIPWRNALNEDLLKMTLGEQLRFSALPMAVFAGAAVGFYLARRHRPARIAVGVGVAALLALEPHLREHALRYAAVAWGYVVDMTTLDMGPPYPLLPDGVGRTFAGWVIKSTLQCTPLLMLAPLALRRVGPRRWALLAVLVPCAALYASLITRANLANQIAIGSPWVYIRYVLPALPGLVVASLAVVEELAPKRDDFVLAGIVAIVLTVTYVMTPDDALLGKRLALLVAPVAVGAASLALTAVALWRADRVSQARPFTRGFVAVAVGFGLASGIGHDLRAHVATKRRDDRQVDALDRALPPRFALVGALGQFDVALTLAVTHDVEYADVLRLRDYAELRPLLEHWWADGRPVYEFWTRPPRSPWPDVSFRPIGVPGFFEVVRAGQRSPT
jgi:hypothetical protein